jgi:hypothetical protein
MPGGVARVDNGKPLWYNGLQQERETMNTIYTIIVVTFTALIVVDLFDG